MPNKKSLYELPRRSTVTSSLILLFAATIYPLWYFALQWFDPSINESLSLRILVGAFAFTGFLCVQIKGLNEKYQILILNMIVFAILSHYHYVLITNNLRTSLVSGNTLLIACIGVIPTHKRWNYSILGWVLILSLFASYVCEAHLHEKMYFIISVFTIVLMVGIVQFDRISTLNLFAKMEIRQRTVINNLSEGVLLYLQSGKIELYNEVAKNILGITSSSTSYHEIAPLLIDEKTNQPIAENFFQQYLMGQRIKESLVLGIQRKDQSTKWVKMSLTPLSLNPKSPHNAIVASLTDLTAEREATKSLEENHAIMIQNAKMAALGEMASGVAHEITNPLAIIQLLSQQIHRESKQTSVNQETLLNATGKINITVQRIGKIIQGLRIYSRNDCADKMEATTAGAILEDTLSFCHESFKNGSIDVVIKKSSDDFSVLCHKAQISQILLNLLHNAKDAMEDCTEKKISIEFTTEKNNVLFSIEDSGPGVPQDIRNKIMQTFFTTKRAGKGTGLGLSISKTIAEKHGGALFLDDTPQGNRFILKLPLHSAKSPQKSA